MAGGIPRGHVIGHPAGARCFAPDLVIISAGFDAHVRDPLGSLN